MGFPAKKAGRWYAVLWDKEESKKRWIKLPESVVTKTEARKLSNQLQSDLEAKRLNVPSCVNVSHFADLAAAEITSKHTIEPVWRDCLEEYSVRFVSHFKETPLHRITASDLEEFMEAEIDEGRSKSTVKKQFLFYRAVFRRAIRDNILDHNASLDVKLPSEPKAKLYAMTRDEFKKLCEKSPPERAFRYRFLVYTGARKSEALATRWIDIDYKNSQLALHNAKKGSTAATKAPRRSIPLPAPFIEELKILQEGENIKSKVFKHKHNWLRDLQLDCKTSGIRKLRIHDLRHTYGTWLALANVSILQIRDLMGHTNVRTTERYAHLLPSSGRETAKVFE